MPFFDSSRDRAAVPHSTSNDASPSTCPACQSLSIVTTAKKPGADSYWRCERCGEIWNASRRQGRRGDALSWR